MLRARPRTVDAKSKPSSVPEKVPCARACRKNSPANAGDAAARRRRPPRPFHVIWKLTVAGVSPAGAARSSTTATARASTVTTLPRGVVSAPSGRRTVHTRPAGVIPPVKSCTREPEPGSKRSIQTKANVPCRWIPSAET